MEVKDSTKALKEVMAAAEAYSQEFGLLYIEGKVRPKKWGECENSVTEQANSLQHIFSCSITSDVCSEHQQLSFQSR